MLGVGSYGEVVRAIHIPSNQHVAIKKVWLTNEVDSKRLLREVSILRELPQHPNIIKLYDVIDVNY